jgi:polysaccharide biosynthesis protein PslH
MHLLWVATKPPWPPYDGGRLVLSLTLEALRAAGHRITLLAPDLDHALPASSRKAAMVEGGTLVRAQPRSWATSLPISLARRIPLTIARHTLAPVHAAVAAALDSGVFDVVVAEQLHALPQCAPALARGVPVVIRAQNVESELWRGYARGAFAPLLRLEARRVAAFEARALGRVAATLTLTVEDAARLAVLGPTGAHVETVAPPFPAELPAADSALPGAPALVILAGTGWQPNVDGTRWFVEALWPAVRAAHPGARLHVFGKAPQGPAVSVYPPPSESRAAFAPGSIQVVPLRVASGIRIKVLEAWARGVPVIATSTAAAGLRARPGEELLLADDAHGFVAALTRLRNDPGLSARLVHGGRAALRARHDPTRIAARWEEILRSLVRARS